MISYRIFFLFFLFLFFFDLSVFRNGIFHEFCQRTFAIAAFASNDYSVGGNQIELGIALFSDNVAVNDSLLSVMVIEVVAFDAQSLGGAFPSIHIVTTYTDGGNLSV